jgi:spore germination protein GerM
MTADTPQAPKAPPAPVSRRTLWTIVAVGGVLVIFGVWLVVHLLPSYLTTPEGGATETTEKASSDERRIQSTLFYLSADGESLVPASRSVLYGATPAEQARRIIEAQIQPPPDGAVSAIPAGTKLLHLFLAKSGEAYVDFGPEIAKAHTGGTLDESLTVYAIVNALTVNLPDVTSVQILVDGKEVDTLAGHIDLRQPLTKSLRWIRKGD